MPYVKQITIRSTLNRSLKYIVNDKKTVHGCLVSGVNCATNEKLAYKQMLANKKRFDKESGTLGFHFIQSFKENEIRDPYQAHEIGLKWAGKLFADKYQFIISTHVDKGHVHNHIIINSVSLDGKKFNACKQSLQDARYFSDEVAKEYNLHVIPFNKNAVPKSYKEWNEERKGNSWKSHIKGDIDMVIKTANSFEDFTSTLQHMGYVIKKGNVKHMTFKAPGMERTVRGKTLGPEYTEDRIKERIQLQAAFHFVETKRKYRYRIKANSTQLKDAAWTYKYKYGSLAVNLILAIALLRALRKRQEIQIKSKSVKRNYNTDIEINRLSNQLLFIVNHDLKSRMELKEAAANTESRIKEINSTVKDARDMSQNMAFIMQSIHTYNKYKRIHEEIQSSTLKKVFLNKKYQAEIETFEKASGQLKKMGIFERDFAFYMDKQQSYVVKIEQLAKRLEEERRHLSKLSDIERTLNQKNLIVNDITTKERIQNREKEF